MTAQHTTVNPPHLANEANKPLQNYLEKLMAAVSTQHKLCSFFSIDDNNIHPDTYKSKDKKRNGKRSP